VEQSEISKMLEKPIREILKVHIDPEANPAVMIKTLRGNIGQFPLEKGIFHPDGFMAVEDLFAGETLRWMMQHAEFQYILKGKAEFIYSLAPWYDEEKTMTVVEGDAVLLPAGADITFKVAPGAPFRRICVIMPAQMSYLEVPPKNVVQL